MRRAREWFLLEGHRLHVTGLAVLALLAVISALVFSSLVPLQNVQPLYYVYGGMISGNLTVVTVVVAINQLLLSRELSTPNELVAEIEGIVDYRRDIETFAGRIAPVDPPGFLRLLVESTRQEAQTLGGLAVSEASEEAYAEIDAVVSDTTEEADRVAALLRTSDASMFDALSTTLTTDYADDIRDLRRIRRQFGDELPAQADESIQNLLHHLKDIDVARQYFKTIFLQEELAAMSRLLFYVGLGSLVAVTAGLLVLTASTGASVSGSTLSLVVAVTITAGLVPISVLFAFMLRIATVTRRTVATIPFRTNSGRR